MVVTYVWILSLKVIVTSQVKFWRLFALAFPRFTVTSHDPYKVPQRSVWTKTLIKQISSTSLQWQSLTHWQGCLLYQIVANTFVCRLQVSKFIDRILIQKKIITTPTRDGKNNENIAKNMYRKKEEISCTWMQTFGPPSIFIYSCHTRRKDLY